MSNVRRRTRRQIVDSGLDETHCYFVDEGGEEVEHGYLFDEIGGYGPSSSEIVAIQSGGYFPSDLSRRKVRYREDAVRILTNATNFSYHASCTRWANLLEIMV